MYRLYSCVLQFFLIILDCIIADVIDAKINPQCVIACFRLIKFSANHVTNYPFPNLLCHSLYIVNLLGRKSSTTGQFLPFRGFYSHSPEDSKDSRPQIAH